MVFVQKISPSYIAEHFLTDRFFVSIVEKKEMWTFDKDDLIWKPNGESILLSWISEKYPETTKNDFNEIKFQVQKNTVIDPEHFQPNPYFLNFNGTELNLRKLEPENEPGFVDPEHYLRTKLKTELDFHCGPPKIFLQCLQNAIPDPKILYLCLQAFSCILLIRTIRLEKAFFFLGSGGNGKSTIMKAVENVFENYISHVDLADLVHDGFAVSQLVGKLANVYADINSLKLRDIKIFKTISSGDTISVNTKYKDRHDETIKVVQFYSANKMPNIEDKDAGFLRRTIPIVFDMVIKERDPYIDDKLNDPEERKSILAMLIKIARITLKHGMLYEPTKDEIERILEDKEEPIIQFLNDPDWVKQGAEYEIDRHELYQLYLKYCKTINVSPKLLNTFSRYVSNRGFQTRKTKDKRYWQGIGVDIREDLKKEENEKLDS